MSEKKEFIQQSEKKSFSNILRSESASLKPDKKEDWNSMTETKEKPKPVFNFKASVHDIDYGICSYPFGSKLKNISTAIKEAEYVLNYADDWDENGALATDQETFEKAVDFVHKYSNYILNHLKAVIEPPLIDIMPDGGMSVTWDTERGTMALFFKKDNSPKAYYFIEDKITNIASNSWIIIGDKPYKTLAAWMEEFLSTPLNQSPK